MPATSSATINPLTVLRWSTSADDDTLVPGEPAVLTHLNPGDLVQSIRVYVPVAWDGSTPTLEISALSHSGEKPVRVLLGNASSDDTGWFADSAASSPWLVSTADALVATVSDGKGGDPESTSGELLVVVEILGAPG